ncbi:MAG: 50S ribosomal protein L4 [Actinomycetes bacterium]
MPAPATTLRGPVKAERPAPAKRSVSRRDMAGKVLGSVDLEPTLFGIVPNEDVLHQVITAQLAAARSGTQSTRTRAESRGGGAKPFNQKGTGRARQGSSRSPSMVGGGVALGPKPRSYAQRTPKKMIRLALASALSDRAANDQIALVDSLSFSEPRTVEAVAALTALGLEGQVLIVLETENVNAWKSLRNLTNVKLLGPSELNAHDIVASDFVLFTDVSLPAAPKEASRA